MRKLPFLQALFPTAKADILAACMLQPEKWWYLSELASHAGTRPSSLQRELKSLAEAGILEQRRDGNRLYVKANSAAPIFPELRGLVEKTAGVLPALRLLLEPFREKIACAFVFGSVAKATEHAVSDIDLMVIGDVGLLELSPGLRVLERKFGREINPLTSGVREFCAKTKAKDHFAITVLGQSKIFVKGDQSDLDNVVGRQRGPASHHLKQRTG